MLLEDYGFIGDLQTSALVGRNGSIDWLCMPSFDSGSCFAALLGGPEHGRWLVAPAAEPVGVTRRRGSGPPRLIRIVEGLRGRVPMRMHLSLRPDYAAVTPWVEAVADGAVATAGPDAFHLCTTVPLEILSGTVESEFVAVESGRYRFALDRYASFEPAPVVEDAESALARTVKWWRDWTGRCTYKGAYRDEVIRSLIVLEGMTDETTGAIVAAPTTSLPEALGGVRNWDYRYCWLRDSVLALEALLAGGYTGEALAFRDFLLRVGTGDPADVQIMYGIRGERRLTEFEVDHLPGYEGSAPVRVGNAAAEQFQLDVYGEVLSVAYKGAEALGRIEPHMWPRWRAVIEYVEGIWQEPDEGIWETRGPRRYFTQSKVMAWVVFDRAVRLAEGFGLDAPLERWRRTRDEIHHEICERGYDPVRGTFTQYYGSAELDASVLLIPLVGFLPPSDDRVTSTIDAIRNELGRDGFVSRYSTMDTDDGLPGDEGQFLACSFWLVSALALNGRDDDARVLFERLLGLTNDLGLLAEEYDVPAGRQVGNFPQAFSHLTLVGAACAITVAERAQAVDPVDGASAV